MTIFDNDSNNISSFYDKFNNCYTLIILYYGIAILVKYTLIENSYTFLLHHSSENHFQIVEFNVIEIGVGHNYCN